ncbi:alpha-amylase [Siphonobacter sp. BAB-5405]|uniref:alpha-amylase family glycosyl hydrolase n=1 Tax=Siphonobacter sp. BAB-5405 TaxID=1864825 RepID=UPI000C7FB084|nr:alpha-amylase family glycosyl hydrolase [Siphonobacter sp. BAB-5405]PMD91642.1 alpha-amylase [Siphonobacter sp. BAB-5405]
MENSSTTQRWWQQGIIYQVYIKSFQDSNADGVGDLRGLIQRLDYFQWLGITALWLSPFYPSPHYDFGYDVSDYTAIDPEAGTFADFEALVAEAHRRQLKIILDLVPNHTSDEHPWFKESRSSRENPKHDWYLWKEPRANQYPPNNWLSEFGGAAWEWEPAVGKYYYHAFGKHQPDLNWRNPEVQQEMLRIMRFWLDRGADGFRIDAFWHLIKDEHWRDNPHNSAFTPDMPEDEQLLTTYSAHQPEIYDIVRKMRGLIDEYEERLMLVEVNLPTPETIFYHGIKGEGAHLSMNSRLLVLPWKSSEIARAIDEYEGLLPPQAWPNWVMANHDQRRIASRVGAPQARVAAMLLLTLRGTPTLYYGDEIGMTQTEIPVAERKDPQPLVKERQYFMRDSVRTNMRWNPSVYGGFSEVSPWIRASTFESDVETQQQDPDSILWLYKRLMALRQREPALHSGVYIPVFSNEQALLYARRWEGRDRFLIALNLSDEPVYVHTGAYAFKGHVELATSTSLEGQWKDNSLTLDKQAGVIIRLE